MKSFEEVMLMVNSSNPDERVLGMRFIGFHRYRAAMDVCILSLKDEHPLVRRWAVWALDRIGTPNNLPDFLDALDDEEFSVRSSASWALIHLARRWVALLVIPHLVDILNISTNKDTKKMVLLTLYHIGGEDGKRAINDYRR
jgi:hypothetical protein